MYVIALLIALFMTGCKKSAESAKADNVATRYTENLHQDVHRAEEVADIANKRINQFNDTVQQGE